jgi:hypothetical protein
MTKTKWTLELVREAFAKEGYILLATEYHDCATKMKFKCPQGHFHEMSIDRWKMGVRCKYCTKCTISIEKIREAFIKEGYVLYSTEYQNVWAKLEGKCPCNHPIAIRWRQWQQGHRCWLCANKKGIQRKTLSRDFVAAEFAKEGYQLLEETYTSNTIKLKCLCPKQHVCYIARDIWTKGKYQCVICRREKAREEKRALLAKEGYTLLNSQHIGAYDKMEYLCPKGHAHSVSYVNWSSHNVRCPFCSGTTSRGEKEIFDHYASLNPIKTREIIAPQELDIYFPSHNLAIEYCGLYWHSEAQDRIYPSYHYKKLKTCNAKGIRLITIFEDEWQHKKELCISRIDAALGINQKKIFARKCEVREISKQEATDFLNKNHLQGYSGCLERIGLFHNGNLVSAMTLGTPSRAHISKNSTVLELKRFASLPNTIVVGGASKLFAFAQRYAKSELYDEIVSYCDMRWGTGKVYRTLGFVFKNASKYTPHYTDFKKRYRNQTLACTKDKTEQQRVKERQLYKIYDCGHQTWSFRLKDSDFVTTKQVS